MLDAVVDLPTQQERRSLYKLRWPDATDDEMLAAFPAGDPIAATQNQHLAKHDE